MDILSYLIEKQEVWYKQGWKNFEKCLSEQDEWNKQDAKKIGINKWTRSSNKKAGLSRPLELFGMLEFKRAEQECSVKRVWCIEHGKYRCEILLSHTSNTDFGFHQF